MEWPQRVSAFKRRSPWPLSPLAMPPREPGQDNRSGLDPELFARSPEGQSDSERTAGPNALAKMGATRKHHALANEANQAGINGDRAQ